MATVEKDLGSVIGPAGPAGKDATIKSATGTITQGHKDSPTVTIEVGGSPGGNTLDFTFDGIQGAPGSDASVPIATTDEVGKVKPDGTSISVDADGTIRIAKVPSTSIDGEIPLANLPQGALERLVTVEDSSSRLELTTDTVQKGDIVQQMDNGVMYVVVDDDQLSSEDGYKEFTAGTAAKATVADKLGSDTVGSSTTPIYLDNGVPKICESVSVSIATADTAGLVKPDGETITVTEDGTISLSADAIISNEKFAALVQDNIETIRTALGTATTEHMGLIPALPKVDIS